jgi:two-component system, OmpR family, response regulator BaeR
MTAQIVVVEDDVKIALLLRDYLTASGYQVHVFGDGKSGLDFVRVHPVDVLLLDIMMPVMDGMQVCRAVREFSQVPIIMLTARVDEIDKLLGLEMGADDYVCKPFSPREVVARVKAQLRRAAFAPAKAVGGARFVVDREAMRVLLDGVALSLTPVEFRLLAELINHPDRVYSRARLLDFVHEDQRDISDRTVDSHIKNVRKKLDARLPGVDCLQSVYGVGYRFEIPA